MNVFWRRVSISAGAMAATVLAAPVSAATVAEFYKDRTMTMIVSSGAGGGYDAYSRLLARHITRHIPGEPKIVVQNMPGANSLTALNYVYNAAPKDGSLISDADSIMPFYALLEGLNTKFDPRKFNWLGSIGKQISVCVAWHTRPFKTIDDILARPMRVSSTAANGWRSIVPRVYDAVAGAKLEVVLGYASAEAFLAVERGEVDGTCATYDTLQGTKFNWFHDHLVTVLAQFGPKPAPGLEDVPLAIERVKDPKDRAAMELLMSQQQTGRPYLAPPAVPADRVAALRAALDATVKDPQFLADAKRTHLAIDPLDWQRMDGLLKEVYASPPDVIERSRALLKVGKGRK